MQHGRKCLENRAGAHHIRFPNMVLGRCGLPAVSTTASSWGLGRGPEGAKVVRAQSIQFPHWKTHCWRPPLPPHLLIPQTPGEKKSGPECESLSVITPIGLIRAGP